MKHGFQKMIAWLQKNESPRISQLVYLLLWNRDNNVPTMSTQWKQRTIYGWRRSESCPFPWPLCFVSPATSLLLTRPLSTAAPRGVWVGVPFSRTSTDLANGGECEHHSETLKSSQIEKNVSLDPTRHCIDTYNKHRRRHVRIHSTVNVIRARIFLMFPVLEGTQRVPPTCNNYQFHVPQPAVVVSLVSPLSSTATLNNVLASPAANSRRFAA